MTTTDTVNRSLHYGDIRNARDLEKKICFGKDRLNFVNGITWIVVPLIFIGGAITAGFLCKGAIKAFYASRPTSVLSGSIVGAAVIGLTVCSLLALGVYTVTHMNQGHAQRKYLGLKARLSEGDNPWLKTLLSQPERWVDSFSDLAPSIPMSVRMVRDAQLAYREEAAGHPHTMNIRMKNLSALVLGTPLTLAARAIRLAWRVGTLPISLLISGYQEKHYNRDSSMRHRVVADVRNLGYDVVDAVVSLVVPVIALANTLHPNAISTDSLETYYALRAPILLLEREQLQAARVRLQAERRQLLDQLRQANTDRART